MVTIEPAPSARSLPSRTSPSTRDPAPEGVRGLVAHPDGSTRCWWCGEDDLYVRYHDTEWGHPVHDDRRLFEKLCLEGFQAGLSWLTILRKRAAFREAFAGFDPRVIAGFTAGDIQRLLGDDRIVRHPGKIAATIANARAYLDLMDTEESLADYVWRFAPAQRTPPHGPEDIPAASSESSALASDLKRRGWRFVGPTTVYAFMQSMGLVNDHLEGCSFRELDPAL